MTDDQPPVVLSAADLALIHAGLITREEVVANKRAQIARDEALRRLSASVRFRLRANRTEWSDLEAQWFDLELDQSATEPVDGQFVARPTVPDHSARIATIKARLLALHQERLDIEHRMQPTEPETRERVRLEALAAASEKAAYRLLNWSFLYTEPHDPEQR